MKTLVTGATGLVGRRLVSRLVERGHDVVVLTRSPDRARAVLSLPCEFHPWDPSQGPPSGEVFQGVDSVIHLAGENIGDKRWSQSQKTKIRDSRVVGTRHLVEAIQRRKGKPLAFISSSAIGYYGDRGEETLTELSNPGTGFLAEVCRDWEREAKALPYGHARVVIVRTGVVLSREGGLLKRLLPIFKTGAAGPLGAGKQWMSWIHIEDLVSLFLFALENQAVEGVLNGVAPQPVTNAEFTRLFAKALGRPAFLPAPAFAIRTMMGEMAELALGSQRVVPQRATTLGFPFRFGTLEAALADLVADRKGADEFIVETFIPHPVEKVFPFFADEKNLEKLTPPWLHFAVLTKTTPTIAEGTLIDYQLKIKGLPVRWQSRIESWEPNRQFVDVQTRGPYSQWHHTHSFKPVKGGTLMRDRILYAVPLGFVGRGLMGGTVRRDLDRIFHYRAEQIQKFFSEPAAGKA